MNKELFDLSIIEKSRQKLKEKQALEEQTIKDLLKEEAANEYRDMFRNREINKRNRASLPTKIKESLIYAFLDKVYTTTLEHMNIEDLNGVRYNMINSYINENGVTKIMNNLSKNSIYLSEVAYQINNLTKTILEKFDEEDNTKIIDVRVDEDDKNSFLDSIDLGSFDQIANKIAERVQQAQVEFIEFNNQDSKHIEEIIAATQEKINSTVKESFIENYQKDCAYAINKVKTSRSKSIYECMVNQICTETYKNDLIGEQLLTKDSKLDFPAVLEMADIMYTFLEMCNTIRLESVDENYIVDVYKNITGKK